MVEKTTDKSQAEALEKEARAYLEKGCTANDPTAVLNSANQFVKSYPARHQEMDSIIKAAIENAYGNIPLDFRGIDPNGLIHIRSKIGEVIAKTHEEADKPDGLPQAKINYGVHLINQENIPNRYEQAFDYLLKAQLQAPSIRTNFLLLQCFMQAQYAQKNNPKALFQFVKSAALRGYDIAYDFFVNYMVQHEKIKENANAQALYIAELDELESSNDPYSMYLRGRLFVF